jgi:hypothetical protein
MPSNSVRYSKLSPRCGSQHRNTVLSNLFWKCLSGMNQETRGGSFNGKSSALNFYQPRCSGRSSGKMPFWRPPTGTMAMTTSGRIGFNSLLKRSISKSCYYLLLIIQYHVLLDFLKPIANLNPLVSVRNLNTVLPSE